MLVPSSCLWTLLSSFKMEVISWRIKQETGRKVAAVLTSDLCHLYSEIRRGTLLDVFSMGTSFSALIFASISSQMSALFWNRTLKTHSR